MPRWLSLTLRLVLCVVFLAACVMVLRHLDWHQLGATLRGAHPGLLALAWVLFVLHIVARTERWYLLLPAEGRPTRRTLLQYLFVSQGVAMVLPPGANEALRVYLLKQRHEVPVPLTISLLTLEKLYEGLGVLFLVAPLPWLIDLPQPVRWSILALVAGGLAATLAAVLLANVRSPFTRLLQTATWQRVIPGLRSLRDPSLFVRAVALSFLGQFASWLGLVALIAAVGLDVPWPTASLVLLATVFAFAVPLVPGHVGTLEAAVSAALHLVGVPLEAALAFALLLHAIQTSHLLLSLSGWNLVTESRAALEPSP